MEVLFQRVSYTAAGVSLMLGSIPGAAYKGIGNTYRSLYIGIESAAGWWATIQSSSIDVYHDWFPRAQNITGIRN